MSPIKTGFQSFRSLVIDVLIHPKKALADVSSVAVDRCVLFGWLCFFVATLATCASQSIFSAEILHQLTHDPARALEFSSVFKSLGAGQLEDLRERLEIVRLSSYASLLLSPVTSWFFLYLLSGALFMLAKILSFGQTAENSYEQVIKIVSIGQIPLLFCLIPLIGPIVGNLWSMWFIARGIGELFKISVFGRVSIVAFSFVFLFSIWNSTMSILVTAYHQDSTGLSAGKARDLEKHGVKSWIRS